MKITRIELGNFRAFGGGVPLDINLETGKNLLVYGENGSGKTSLFFSLSDFLESSVESSKRKISHEYQIDKTPYRNLFADKKEETFVRLSFSDGNSYEWSNANTQNQIEVVRDLNKTKGFLDYKKLLHTYFLQQEQKSVNVFKFFVENLLTESFNDSGAWPIGGKWQEIQTAIAKRNDANQTEEIEILIAEFNGGLTIFLAELAAKAQLILNDFYKNLTINIRFGGISYPLERKDRIRIGKQIQNQEIKLTVDFYDKQEENHHQFLNEAKLSAVAISIFLASLPVMKNNAPRIIALDDVLIGLDMANRKPILKILEKHFANDQIFFFTYDRAWFEMVKSRIDGNKWKKIEFFTSKIDSFELPVFQDSKTLIEKAEGYYNANDYKACAAYARSHFEKIIKEFCQRKKIAVVFNEEIKKVQANDFWCGIEAKSKDNAKKNQNDTQNRWILPDSIIADVNKNSKTLLNEAVHSSTVTLYGGELYEAIDVVKNLEIEFAKII